MGHRPSAAPPLSPHAPLQRESLRLKVWPPASHTEAPRQCLERCTGCQGRGWPRTLHSWACPPGSRSVMEMPRNCVTRGLGTERAVKRARLQDREPLRATGRPASGGSTRQGRPRTLGHGDHPCRSSPHSRLRDPAQRVVCVEVGALSICRPQPSSLPAALKVGSCWQAICLLKHREGMEPSVRWVRLSPPLF